MCNHDGWIKQTENEMLALYTVIYWLYPTLNKFYPIVSYGRNNYVLVTMDPGDFTFQIRFHTIRRHRIWH